MHGNRNGFQRNVYETLDVLHGSEVQIGDAGVDLTLILQELGFQGWHSLETWQKRTVSMSSKNTVGGVSRPFCFMHKPLGHSWTEADTVSSVPTIWAVFQGGDLVAVVRGADAPLLQKTILDQLEAEKRVLARGGERRVIKDEALSNEVECFSHEKDDGEDEDVGLAALRSVFLLKAPSSFGVETQVEHHPRLVPVASEKACTLAIIKPDAVVHGKTDEIIMKSMYVYILQIQEAGFDILTNEERTMTEEEMRLFYQRRAGEEAFEKLLHYMCSGPSRLLILTRTEGTEDVVTAWRTLMGPCDPDVARREQPDSLRAQYGTEMPFNAVHGSQDSEDARWELALLFPSFKFSHEVLEAPLGRKAAGAEGPSKVLCFPEDVDEAAELSCQSP
ncbi:Thioredoxin domain-containing protein 6 [Camelus dromedarius]|uniref:Thioredoxin domain-containing protein 6 n=1 Tax=Camelus dromedarius TaxID=9838 RepID=A0A5N4EIA9_CAMDR|nr:Thioredoxin domain-containing protein 6 [Camelus dromedarius]